MIIKLKIFFIYLVWQTQTFVVFVHICGSSKHHKNSSELFLLQFWGNEKVVKQKQRFRVCLNFHQYNTNINCKFSKCHGQIKSCTHTFSYLTLNLISFFNVIFRSINFHLILNLTLLVGESFKMIKRRKTFVRVRQKHLKYLKFSQCRIVGYLVIPVKRDEGCRY